MNTLHINTDRFFPEQLTQSLNYELNAPEIRYTLELCRAVGVGVDAIHATDRLPVRKSLTSRTSVNTIVLCGNDTTSCLELYENT